MKHVEVYRTKSKKDHYLVFVAGEPHIMDYDTGEVQRLFQTKAIVTEFRRMAARMQKVPITKLSDKYTASIRGLQEI